jgi:TRAP-type C4-dicarboxylate transport system permease small subunit
MRYIFNSATTWSDTLASSALAWLTFFATTAAIRRDDNLAVRGAWAFFGPTGRKVISTICDLLVLAFALLLMSSGLDLMSITSNTIVEGLVVQVSWAQIYSVSVLCGAIMILFSLERIWVTWARGGPEAVEPLQTRDPT